MAMKLNPYITFQGNTQEAMDFYAAALGGTVRALTFQESGIDAPGIMHAALETPTGFHLYAGDDVSGLGGPEYVKGNNVQVSLSGDDVAALRGMWEKLSDGATVVMPLEKQMWGDVYGYLVDKFGIAWHVNIADDDAQA